MNKFIRIQEIGTKDYKDTWEYQEKLFKEIIDIKIKNRRENKSIKTPNYFLFVEHPHVYTLGKSGDLANLLLSEKQLEVKGATFYKINRGGDITYHGPGQIVGYPILDLEKFKPDLGWYLRNLEEVIIKTLADYGLHGDRSKGETGVWLDPLVEGKARKICAMGIKCSRWITMHGFAFNVNTDLKYFDKIVPCGIKDKQVTSLAKELGYKVDYEEVKKKVLQNFKEVFDVDILMQ